ncbi:MAG: hypothetical protein J6K61_05895 [Clostridia bacterium]|nr:hypothetical protein [Clostridia bacterium]
MRFTFPKPFLSGSVLKWLALALMTLDHIGLVFCAFMPPWLYQILRLFGRVSFPLFAFCVAEGYTHTKNRKAYGLRLALFGIAIQAVYFVYMKSLNLNIFVTLALSVLFMWLCDISVEDKRWALLFIPTLAATAFLCYGFFGFYGLSVSYDIFGVLLPVFVYIGRTRKQKIVLFAIGMLFLCLSLRGAPLGAWQWFCLFALPLVCLYNGKAGRGRCKYFFYLYYPLHLCVLWGIRLLLQ